MWRINGYLLGQNKSSEHVCDRQRKRSHSAWPFVLFTFCLFNYTSSIMSAGWADTQGQRDRLFFFFFKRSTHLWHNCKRWPVDLQQNQKATAWPFGSILRGAFMLYRECTWLLCSCCRCTPRMKHTTCCFCPLHLYCHIADILDIYIRHTTFSF